jgi:hypothetical protein
MIKSKFTIEEEKFIIECIPNRFKTIYDIISVKVILDDLIKVKVRLKSNGEVSDEIIRLSDMDPIYRELILNNILTKNPD